MHALKGCQIKSMARDPFCLRRDLGGRRPTRDSPDAPCIKHHRHALHVEALDRIAYRAPSPLLVRAVGAPLPRMQCVCILPEASPMARPTCPCALIHMAHTGKGLDDIGDQGFGKPTAHSGVPASIPMVGRYGGDEKFTCGF
jgi:hypothetical protein